MEAGHWENDRKIGLLWADHELSIWNTGKNHLLENITWSHVYWKDYLCLATQYQQAGYTVLNEVVQAGHDNFKDDTWFLAGIFMLRQSVELVLKAKVYEVFSEKKKIQEFFKKTKHNLVNILRELKAEDESIISEAEFAWLQKYLSDVEEIDSSSTLFRYPFKLKFLDEYSNKFVQIRNTANTMLLAYDIIFNSLNYMEKVEIPPVEDFPTPTFFTFTDNGIGNFRLGGWNVIVQSADDYYGVIQGYTMVSEFLVSVENNGKMIFPILFTLRHSLELELKQLASSDYSEISSLRIDDRSHKLYNKLWLKLKPIIETMGHATPENDPVENVDKLIFEFDQLDKKSDFFRYPTEYNQAYHELPKSIDIQNTLECVISAVNFFEGLDGLFDNAAENYY